jgi:hypothetical protein
MTSMMSQSFSAWRTNVPGQRDVPGTPHLLKKRGRVPSLMRALLTREVATRTTTRRRLVAITSRWSKLPPSQFLLLQRVGAEVPETINTPVKHPTAMSAEKYNSYSTDLGCYAQMI